MGRGERSSLGLTFLERLHETGYHAAQLQYLLKQCPTYGFVQIAQPVRQDEKRLNFSQGSPGYAHEVNEFARAAPACAFGDIG